MRGLLRALALELFGANLTVPEFPRVKSLRGLGTSDGVQYADALGARLDYRNTIYDREPRFDIARPDPAEVGRYDFLLSSEVFEHVPPPVSAAFDTAFRLLKSNGFLLLTVPYSFDTATAEHFAGLHQFGLVRVGDRVVLVNRSRDGKLQVFEDLVFHVSFGAPALEMREFSESDLRAMLCAAGFTDVRIYSEEYAPYGILHTEACSLPIVARKGPFSFGQDAARDLVEQWRDVRQAHDAEMRRLGKSLWFRAGRKLGLL
jgi:SAM-dependent methyltransferase